MHFQFLIIIEPFFTQVVLLRLVSDLQQGLVSDKEWYLILHFYQVMSLRRSVANVNMKRDPRTSFFLVLCAVLYYFKTESLPYLHRDYNKTFIQNFVLQIITTIQAVWINCLNKQFTCCSIQFIFYFIFYNILNCKILAVDRRRYLALVTTNRKT